MRRCCRPSATTTAIAATSDAAPIPVPAGQAERTPVTRIATFDAEFRSGYGYNQPSSALASVGVMAAGTGDTASKYVARRETPLFIPENCTQCMECIAVCPDTALPNCSQDVETILHTAVTRYVTDPGERRKMLQSLPEIEKRARQMMSDAVAKNAGTPLPQILRQVTAEVDGFSEEAKRQFFAIIDKVPMAYQKVNAIFSTPERKKPGAGGIFSIFVTDLCKGCAACVTACGDHEALKMVEETEEVNAEHETGTGFLNLLPDTPQKYLGLYNDERPQDSKTATLRNMLMVRHNYDALVSGDGACAGCGEKSVLRAIAAATEAYMRPLYHAKADRLRAKAAELDKSGVAEARRAQSTQSGGVRTAAPGRGALADGAWWRGRQGHQGPHCAARSHLRRRNRGRDHRRHAAGGLQPQGSAGDRRPPAQRHVRHGDDRSHRLQHRLWLHAAQQSAPVSLDELALPGRRHHRLAAGRELHRRSRAALRHSRAAGGCPAQSRKGRHHAARVLRVHALQRHADDRPGDP